MRRTRFGALLLAVGWGCFPLAIAFGTLAPALFGILLVAWVIRAPRPAVDLHVAREVPEQVAAGEPFDLILRVEDARGSPVFAEEALPPGLRVVSSSHEPRRGSCVTRMRLVAEDPGILLWTEVRVRFQDSWGSREDEASIRLVETTAVRVESSLLARARRAGKGFDEQVRTRSLRGFDVEPEVERLREHRPGDRLRDIDWAHSSKLDRLIARELRRDALVPVVVLLDATRPMRQRRRHSRLASCARAALSVLVAADAQGIGVGFVAWSENGLEARVRAGGGRRALTAAMLSVSELPPTLPPGPLAAAPLRRVHGLSEPERAFLAATNAFAAHSAGPTTPLEGALAAISRVSAQPSLVVAFLDAEDTPETIGLVARRLRAHGHRIIFVAPANGAHDVARHELDPEWLAQLVVWRRNREEARQEASRAGASYLILPPGVNERIVEKVVRASR